MNQSTRFGRRFAVLGGTVLGGLLLLGGPAAAAPGDAPDPATARQAATAPAATELFASFFVNLDARTAGKGIAARPAAAALAAKQPAVVGDPVRVHTLNPAFVAGTSASPVADSGLALQVRSASGQQAVALLSAQGSSWQVDTVRGGLDEVVYARQAAGGTAFQEPQINAWYALRGDRVLPLNDAARTAVGTGTTVAGYQKLVKARYGDKLAGSSYQRDGKYGGYGAPAARSGFDYPLLVGGLLAVAALAWVLIRPRRSVRD